MTVGMRERFVALLLAASVVAAGGCSVGNDVSGDAEKAREFEAFPLYWAGERFEELDVSYAELGSPAPAASFIYGTCEITGDHGCAPPLQIQIFPLCFHLDEAAANRAWTRRQIRGAPVGLFDGAPVMFTRHTQIKVYRGQDSDPGMALRALRALRSLNAVPPRIGPVGSIPPAAPGVLEGTTPCRKLNRRPRARRRATGPVRARRRRSRGRAGPGASAAT
ncbi:hypothetical protein BH09ACT13_BH09ACT13_16680 [soil metagenome]